MKKVMLSPAALFSVVLSVALLAGCSNLFLPQSRRPAASGQALDPSFATSRAITTSVQTLFTDNFNRPDSPDIGNGWIEKTPSVFSLVNDSVVKVQASDYRDCVVYRPSSEAIRDVQASDVFTDTASDSYAGYPQVWVRIQSDTVAIANTLTGYVLYIPNSSTVAEIARNVGTADVQTLRAIDLTQALQPNGRYRLTFQAVGADPVQLDAEVDWYNGSSWQVIGAGSYTDTSTLQITTAGVTGFGGDTQAGTFAYTNFTYGVPAGSSPPPSGPTASFADACSGLTCSFTNTSTDTGGTISSSSWSFGDGGTSSATSPSYTYGAAGTYTVSLTVTDGTTATNSTSQSVTVSAPQAAGFTDNFNRANGPIGNGWIEKDSSTFAIQNDEVVKVTPAGSYRDNIVYRPASEDLLNVQDSIEFTDTGGSGSTPGYPQIWARVDSNTVSTTNVLDGYILYVYNSPTTAYLGQQHGTNYVVALQQITLSRAIQPGQRYRLTLNVEGTSPVQLTGTIEWYNGSSWQVVGSGSVNDSSSGAITTAGTVGFSASGLRAGSYAYDNFAYGPAGSTPPPPPPPGNQPPSASFTYSCSRLSCAFTNTSSDPDGTITSSSWSFGDGGTSTATSPSYTYSSPGTYTVALTVTDNGGASSSTSQTVRVQNGRRFGRR